MFLLVTDDKVSTKQQIIFFKCGGQSTIHIRFQDDQIFIHCSHISRDIFSGRGKILLFDLSYQVSVLACSCFEQVHELMSMLLNMSSCSFGVNVHDILQYI